MQPPLFVVRWTDKDGKNHRKEYDTEPAARKAKQWLVDNGAPTADIAVSLNGKEHKGTDGGAAFPGNAEPGIQQQAFLQ